MKDLQEAYADAVDLVEDFLDIDTLEDYLYQSLTQNCLEYWSQFENALQEASDSPTQEEELFAQSRHIVADAVSRVEHKYQIIKIDRVKRYKELIEAQQKEIAKLEEVIRYQKEEYYKLNN